MLKLNMFHQILNISADKDLCLLAVSAYDIDEDEVQEEDDKDD